MKTILFIACFILNYIAFGQTKTCVEALDSLTNQKVFLKAEVMPEPELGMYELQKRIRQNITVDSGTEVYTATKAYVGFIVCEDGSIVGERIISDSTSFNLGNQILQAALKLKWKPGKCLGKSVPVLFKLPTVICLK